LKGSFLHRKGNRCLKVHGIKDRKGNATAIGAIFFFIITILLTTFFFTKLFARKCICGHMTWRGRMKKLVYESCLLRAAQASLCL